MLLVPFLGSFVATFICRYQQHISTGFAASEKLGATFIVL
jgi:hypothetical protein